MQDHEFILRRSNRFLCLSIGLTIASLAIVISLAIPVSLKCCLFMLVLVYGTFIIRQYAFLQGSKAIVAIRRLSDGRWYVSTRDHSVPVRLVGESTVTNFAMVLRFRKVGGSWAAPRLHFFNGSVCVVFPDALAPDLYRQLLVILKTEKIQ